MNAQHLGCLDFGPAKKRWRCVGALIRHASSPPAACDTVRARCRGTRRWGIELTEGQPDASANKANEKKSRTMKKTLAAAGLGAAAITALVGAGTAQADTAYDNYRYLQGLNNNGIYVINTDVAISNGHTICAKASQRSASVFSVKVWGA